MNVVMERTRRALNESGKYRSLIEGLSAVNFHENREGTEVVVTLCNGSPLAPHFAELSEELVREVGMSVKAVVGRARKEKVVSDNSKLDFVTETMHLFSPPFSPSPTTTTTLRDTTCDDTATGTTGDDDMGGGDDGGRTMTYVQPEGSFSNPNGDIAELTANWLCGKMRGEGMKAQQRKFVEFYCGNANHGCYLSNYFTAVLGVEIDPELCRAAEVNFTSNGITNGVIINKPAEEVARRRHLYSFSDQDFLLVDPPRAGLDPLTLSLVRHFRFVVYIACDARSLARDLRDRGLGESHRVVHMAAFDHFPWHAEFLEVVCWLERKEEKTEQDIYSSSSS
jgi:tRNA/tmRNA/rRNA uracil-C5-methylase (TrmA/RlmC/RlmD family)